MTSIGKQLAAERERSGKSVQDVERAIKIRAKYVEALEADDFDSIPGDAYVLGFIKSYCELLAIDPTPLLDAYRAEHQLPAFKMPQPVMSATKEHPRIPPALWIGALAIAVAAFLIWLGINLASALRPATTVPEPTATSVVAEPTRTAAATATPQPRPKPVPRPRPFTLRVTATQGDNWLAVTVDGKRTYDGDLPADKSLSWRVRKAIVLRTNTAEMFRVYRNGKYVGLLGKGFSVQTRVYKASVK